MVNPSSKSIRTQVKCYQYMRLRQHYEAALRRWKQIAWNTSANRVAAEVKYKALEERNAAKERMEYAIAKGEGGVYLRLRPDQYARLRRPRLSRDRYMEGISEFRAQSELN